MKDFLRNWQTSGAAFVSACVGMAILFYPEHRDFITKFGVAFLAFVTAAGFLFAKDGNKTGTTGNPR